MAVFKKCTACDSLWPSRESFLNDPDTELVGYQVNFENYLLEVCDFNERGYTVENKHDCSVILVLGKSCYTERNRDGIRTFLKTNFLRTLN